MTPFKFLLRVFLLCIICLIVDRLLIFLIDRKIEANFDWRMEKVIEGQVNADILIIGSSRGARGIIASEITDKTHRSCFNFCYPGSNLMFHQFLFNTYLKFNKKPKTILLSIDDDFAFKESPWLSFRNNALYALTKYDYVNEELIGQQENHPFSRYFNIARLRKIHLNFGPPDLEETDILWKCGSMPIPFKNKAIIFGPRDTTAITYDVNAEAPRYMDAYKDILKKCAKLGIEVYVVLPPNYRPLNPAFFNRVKEVTPKSAEIFVYNQAQRAYADSNYFYDPSHLRQNGASLFSGELATFLLQKSPKK